MSSTKVLSALPARYASGVRGGITSICSAHPLVIEAALLEGVATNTDVLIEATCNQVNQDGGYTGMTPADFRHFVEEIAARVGFDTKRLILGGDHLGPNPWKHLPAEEALAKSDVMIDAFVRAGFTKIHLDTSMGCAGEPVALPDAVTAERAARLAKVAEAAAREAGYDLPVYIIGTEVPIPGGAMEEIEELELTKPDAAVETVSIHRKAFAALGLEDAFARAIGVVVQPGVEFGNENVVFYNSDKATALSGVLGEMPQFVFEAHSTDYQPVEALSDLVHDGFAILKVGPGLTFALREALYGLDQIAAFLDKLPEEETLRGKMEALLLAEPKNWEKYYHGDAEELRLQRHFSYSDRIRYYWPHPVATAAVNALLKRLEGRKIPETLISQYLGTLYPAVASGAVEATPHALMVEAVRNVVRTYGKAVGTH
ncbi:MULTISPECIES: D-tagatose-bisphosphate aldolase, class II, non-catalytic subunit [Brucella/Ochrobactrum group]|uniref:D-tagatose-bisphosphate aldolase, class II, non-catalytic subunit n=1 Tax=Brucella pseudintermedia TaxID=370111 RepID=A0ABY5UB30_9HYPH|nr:MULTISPECIES: D-tagatose-bisphosphate aldolase, class II, non-catalytic subunit [Brucella/Ochrobactrum group]KAB2681888.1 D-tagatose-bisphosphate aldolase, class II, non-catalytic subunit [Brucella pseudintermedia]NKE75939.1 D-tagatose-bisphosphate aldolase, class II, non-catalytic subunit [Ochrobactrum sp. MC-1LL]TWH00490.1 D-tagatose-1,6-bisphosphate aldolase subunit GatZ/KbaZ [Ochrobactrum sp. J50]UWL59932.1 D-tagatose-bisphosphate aldolase, class II, non-catalytic subunit [Brucella pseud